MGGVIVRTEEWRYRQEWEARLDLAPGELSRLVFDGEPSRRASIGEGTVEEIWNSIAGRFHLSDEQRQQLESDFWRGDRVDYDLVEFIDGLRADHQTALVSNAWPNVRGYIEGRWDIDHAFDLIIISAEVGRVKPDPQIYQLALDGLNLPAQASVFIDDFPRNIEGARNVGMHALLFESADQIQRDLMRLLAE
jgi:HAD superfamily hydrolase (TIGR01509 family)